MSKKLGNFLATITKKAKKISNEKKLLKKINDGFLNKEFKMYLQFIVDSKEKRICSAETLSRWVNSSGDVVFPREYIGLMEKSGLIVNFDYYMFEKVCEKLCAWKGTEFDNITLSCNFTRITISEKDFVTKIENIAKRYK